jgi:cytoskeletal protein CcmA (bactofilin family)
LRLKNTIATNDELKEPAQKRAPPALLGADLSISGTIKSSGEIQIDGSVDGEIHCVRLVVGVSAVVHGTIKADTVLIAGQFNGQIMARDVVFGQSARVIGDIFHEQLTVEFGAFFEGSCKPPASAAHPSTIDRLRPSATIGEHEKEFLVGYQEQSPASSIRAHDT